MKYPQWEALWLLACLLLVCAILTAEVLIALDPVPWPASLPSRPLRAPLG